MNPEDIQQFRSQLHSIYESVAGLAKTATSVLWFLYAAVFFNWLDNKNDQITIYFAQCSNSYLDGKCPSKEIAFNRETFKVSYISQIVVSQVEDPEKFSPRKLINCSVVDTENWTCLGDAFIPIKKLSDGNFYTETNRDDYHQVSKWKYYFLKLLGYFNK